MRPSRLSERELLVSVAYGVTDKEIAAQWDLALGSVKNRVSRLRMRLGIRNRAQLAAFACLRGIVNGDGFPDLWRDVTIRK
jgi:DNA-binding NarL/FixJ family response regulator